MAQSLLQRGLELKPLRLAQRGSPKPVPTDLRTDFAMLRAQLTSRYVQIFDAHFVDSSQLLLAMLDASQDLQHSPCICYAEGFSLFTGWQNVAYASQSNQVQLAHIQ